MRNLICVLIATIYIFPTSAAWGGGPATAPAPDEHFTATLPDGMKVELLGLTQGDALHWWKPDGSPQTVSPNATLERRYGGDKPTALRLIAVPADKELAIFFACRGDFPV